MTSFPLRAATSIVAVPILLGLAWVGGYVYLAFALLLLVLALREFNQLLESKGLSPHWKAGMAAVLLAPVAAFQRLRTGRIQEWHLGALLTILVLGVLLAELRRGAGKQAIANSAATLLGVFYIGWLGTHIVLLRELPWVLGEPYARGAAYAMLPFVMVWCCDTAAYLVGRAFGRRRLMPEVSPRKTAEGAWAGLLAAIAAAFLARATFARFLTVGDAALLGFFVGVFGQLGDLVESLLKRDSEAKDTSQLIPGHGGVLDRFDSLFFAAPVVYYFLLFRAVGP
ncbi:MAG TPA: phosphatidate cytidylyltransferase [Candidatus Eisenbacteria bacterium]|nr:phosphatidate cytidylyltransferase [Candidatus Eisenbacteria bacterium]